MQAKLLEARPGWSSNRTSPYTVAAGTVVQVVRFDHQMNRFLAVVGGFSLNFTQDQAEVLD